VNANAVLLVILFVAVTAVAALFAPTVLHTLACR
jgi:hypothetical protein